MMGLGMGFGILFLVIFWGVLILGAVWLVRSIFAAGEGRSGAGRAAATPREILDQRYARGELSRDEYEVIRQDLEA